MQFATDVDDARINALSAAIAQQLGDPAKRQRLAQFALERILDWMAGRASYQTITEQQVAWLGELLPLFYPGEAPSAGRLFNDFAVPYGRASYMARVLLEKQQTEWRQHGRQTVRDAIKAKYDEAITNIKRGDKTKVVPISLNPIAYRELKLVLEDIDRAQPDLPSATDKSAGPARRTIDIPSLLFPEILKRLEA